MSSICQMDLNAHDQGLARRAEYLQKPNGREYVVRRPEHVLHQRDATGAGRRRQNGPVLRNRRPTLRIRSSAPQDLHDLGPLSRRALFSGSSRFFRSLLHAQEAAHKSRGRSLKRAADQGKPLLTPPLLHLRTYL